MGKTSKRRNGTAPSLNPLSRLKTMLEPDDPWIATGRETWEAFEPNPWMTAIKASSDDAAPNKGGDDDHSLADFPAESQAPPQLVEAEDQPVDADQSDETAQNDRSLASEATERQDSPTPRPAVTELLAKVSEVSDEVMTQLTGAVQAMRKAAAEQHAEEIASLEQRHAEELEQVREAMEAEMAKNWAQESKRLREELEQRHAAELRDAQAAVIDSFKGLKGQILEGLQ